MEENTRNNINKQNNKNEGGIGPIVGTLIIVIVLVAAAVYIWSEHLNTAAQIQQEERQNSGTTTIITYSTSTEPADIQSDLKTTPTPQNAGF